MRQPVSGSPPANTAYEAKAVWKGTYIDDRFDGQFFVQLYYLGAFYAEVFYNQETNKIIKVRGCKSTKLIKPYLKGIRIGF